MIRAVASRPTTERRTAPPAAPPDPAPSPPLAPAPAPSRVPQFFPGPDDPQWPPNRPFAAVALDNLLDSVTDIGRHLGRMDTATADGAGPSQEQLVPGGDGRMRLRSSTKPVVLVLGSGWGAHSLIKVIDTDTYDVVVVSPRNHFLFTPMLPSTAVGTVEFRSLLEPVRTSNPCVTYLEAECDELDPNAKVAVCTSSLAYDDGRRPCFEIQYDVAVVAVGEQPATFGVPGVREHCYFMKEVTDAVSLRKRIAEKFELASLPGTSEADRRAALHFVVVGGGPTGVEFAGTLSDFLREDLRKKYPALMKYVRVSLLQSGQSILTQFDAALGQRALEALASTGVEVRLGVRVVKATRNQLILKDGEPIDFGVCVWSTGNAPRPLVQQIAAAVADQADAAKACGAPPATKLVVDSFLRVVGAEGLLALGDCSAVVGNRLPATAQVAGQQGSYLAHLINSGYTLGVGGYRQPPPYKAQRRSRLEVATEESPFLGWMRTAVMGGEEKIRLSAEVSRAIELVESPPWLRPHVESMTQTSLDKPGAAAECDISAILAAAAASGGATRVDAAAAVRQCVLDVEAAEAERRQQGRAGGEAPVERVDYWERPFEFLSLGIMAYVGNDKALTQVEAFDVINLKLSGSIAFLLWKSVYITKQVSFRNRVLILFDWLKARVFGRDISLF